jgi:hypothetical protein
MPYAESAAPLGLVLGQGSLIFRTGQRPAKENIPEQTGTAPRLQRNINGFEFTIRCILIGMFLF